MIALDFTGTSFWWPYRTPFGRITLQLNTTKAAAARLARNLCAGLSCSFRREIISKIAGPEARLDRDVTPNVPMYWHWRNVVLADRLDAGKCIPSAPYAPANSVDEKIAPATDRNCHNMTPTAFISSSKACTELGEPATETRLLPGDLYFHHLADGTRRLVMAVTEQLCQRAVKVSHNALSRSDEGFSARRDKAPRTVSFAGRPHDER